jgi:hypothetical protein
MRRSERLSQWQGTFGNTFKISTITGDLEAIRRSWGIKALPWLILTDRNHVVTAEGFGIDELNERISSMNKK